MPHDVTEEAPDALDFFDILPEDSARAATLSVDELAGSFVGDAGGIAWQNGRAFVCFKPPGQQRNMLYELLGTPARLSLPLGVVPGTYFKSGGCAICFGPGGEVWVLDTCSPDPTTGGAARPVLWKTGIFVGVQPGVPGPKGPQGVQGIPGPAGGVSQASFDQLKAQVGELALRVNKHLQP